MKGIVIQREYEEINSQGYVFIFGRLENGESFICMNEFNPYFFIKEKDKKILEKLDNQEFFEIEETNLTSFKAENVVKIIFKNQTSLKEISKEMKDFQIETFEEDLKPSVRFMIENDLKLFVDIEGDYEKNERVDRFYLNPKIKKSNYEIIPKVASIDIESDKKGKKLFCIGIYSKDKKEVLMITKEKIEGVLSCRNERECLEKFREKIIEIDPDIITGWNVIDFDLALLNKLFNENKIDFDIGRTNKKIKLKIEKNFLKKSKAKIPGRVVLDGLNLLKDPFIQEAPTIKKIKLESFALEEVSKRILDKKKLIEGIDRSKEIEKLYRGNKEDKRKLAEYNIQDCRLAYEIVEKTKMIELAVERANLTGMQLDQLTSSIASFDSLYIRKAKKKNLVSPSSIYKQKQEKITGGFVLQPDSGIYKNVFVFDFKSIYPSIIRTFNIDPSSLLNRKEKDCITSPNGAVFRNQDGILPEMIQELYEAREKAKRERRELSSYAIKIIMNSFFGILASPNSRYFDLKLGNSITTFGQEIIKLTMKKIEENGDKVIYGDTDSIFVQKKNEKNLEEFGIRTSREINKFYIEYVMKNYKRKSFLELEFEKRYKSLLFPGLRKKEEERGAKKRYAGLLENEELEIVGLEAIRGDWTEAARIFQKELLKKMFLEEDIIPFIKDFIKKIKEGRLDKELIYRKSIRKGLEEYTKTTPPHVKAARKLEKIESNLIEYYITLSGPEPIQKLMHKIDYEHYIEKQIKPIATTILEVKGISPEKVFSETSQKKLF
jgi:DNA polymerase II